MKSRSSHIKRFLAVFVLVMTAAFCCYGQKGDFEKEAVCVKTYGGKEFKKSLFFSGMAVDKNGSMLFATTSGLFIMTGQKTVRYKTEHFSGISRLIVDCKNNIFGCGDNDFGYFEPQEDGGLHYIPLTERSEISGKIIDDVAEIGQDMWFFSRKGVFRYDKDKNITQISDTGAVKNANSCNLPFYIDTYGNLFYLSDGRRYFKIALHLYMEQSFYEIVLL